MFPCRWQAYLPVPRPTVQLIRASWMLIPEQCIYINYWIECCIVDYVHTAHYLLVKV